MKHVRYDHKPHIERIGFDVCKQMISIEINDGGVLRTRQYSYEQLAEVLLQFEGCCNLVD
jgi:hypothetical protein